MRPPWLPLVQAALAPWRGRAVVVAVSGGGDSVALLRALSYLRDDEELQLSVATLDHATRAGASAADAAFVAELADRLGLPCDLGRWQAERPGHFEADARRARYAWLLEVGSRFPREDATTYTDIDLAFPAGALGYTHKDGRPYRES